PDGVRQLRELARCHPATLLPPAAAGGCFRATREEFKGQNSPGFGPILVPTPLLDELTHNRHHWTFIVESFWQDSAPMSHRYVEVRERVMQLLLSTGGGAATETLLALGADKRDLTRMCEEGVLTRVTRGLYALDHAAGDDLWQQQRSEHLRHATAICDAGVATVALRSAALARTLPVSRIPDRPEVMRPPGSAVLLGARTLRRALAPSDVQLVRGVPVTSIARTAVDVALDLPTPEALITVDAALRRGATEGAMSAILTSLGGVRGCRAARLTLELADPHAESALESRGRGELLVRGAPRPLCNVSFRIGETEFRVDHWWPEIPLVGEADGVLKYSGDQLREALWQEKLRQEWFEDTLGLTVFRYCDREVRLAPDALLARFRRRAEHARSRLWTPPAHLEIFQRPPPGSNAPVRWLGPRGELKGQESA
ncbi:MAG TPA: type IV toxin-antitoxin system AbiEi family antitoxin domain-containing protein, partial [Actinomycetes bacterium]|nr:type IV toxin-antitoxin system AbiEi family antitoxin domain-containing protein [Actinomycetes bacterium]